MTADGRETGSFLIVSCDLKRHPLLWSKWKHSSGVEDNQDANTGMFCCGSFEQACQLKTETITYEEKEQQLVNDCVKELSMSCLFFPPLPPSHLTLLFDI